MLPAGRWKTDADHAQRVAGTFISHWRERPFWFDASNLGRAGMLPAVFGRRHAGPPRENVF